MKEFVLFIDDSLDGTYKMNRFTAGPLYMLGGKDETVSYPEPRRIC